VLHGDRAVADYYEGVVHAGAEAKAAANWVMGEVLADAKDHAEALRVPPGSLAQLIGLVKGGTLSHQAGKRVFTELANRGGRSAHDRRGTRRHSSRGFDGRGRVGD